MVSVTQVLNLIKDEVSMKNSQKYSFVFPNNIIGILILALVYYLNIFSANSNIYLTMIFLFSLYNRVLKTPITHFFRPKSLILIILRTLKGCVGIILGVFIILIPAFIITLILNQILEFNHLPKILDGVPFNYVLLTCLVIFDLLVMFYNNQYIDYEKSFISEIYDNEVENQ
jgi:hypothetical protein